MRKAQVEINFSLAHNGMGRIIRDEVSQIDGSPDAVSHPQNTAVQQGPVVFDDHRDRPGILSQLGLMVRSCNTTSAIIRHANANVWAMAGQTSACDHGAGMPKRRILQARTVPGVGRSAAGAQHLDERGGLEKRLS
jgi:hypothetical protein